MVDTRHRVRGAGDCRVGGAWTRRAALGALYAGALAGCLPAGTARVAGAPPSPSRGAQEFLVPVARVRGGFVPVGGAATLAPGGFVALRAPVAAAARGPDLYIADAGHQTLFRYDLTTQTLHRLRAGVLMVALRLCLLADRSLMLLDVAARQLVRVSHDGSGIARLPRSALMDGALDLACDATLGRVWITVPGAGRLLAVMPAMAAAELHAVDPGEPDSVGPLSTLAVTETAIFALEPARRRVVQLDHRARVLRTFGDTVLRQPHAIAVDRYQRVYVADAFDNALHVFQDARRVATWSAQQLGVAAVSDLRVADTDLAIADAPGGSVHVYRLLGDAPAR